MDISKLLQLIPNSVSGDGKSFVAALKKFLLAAEEDTDSKIEDATEKPAQVISVSLTEEHSVNDGTRVNTILVQWDTTNIDNYAKAEVWYKADNAEWAKAGESAGVQYRYEGATAGSTYSVKVVAINTKGNAADFDSAPQADISIKGSQYIPSAPTQFVLTWDDEGALWEWLAEDNGYIDFFELRLDNNPGTWSSKRLDSTREQHSRANPGVRGGTAYLYVRNIFGEYSEPAIHTFGKAMGSKPTAATLTATLDGVNIKMAGLPEGYTHYKLHIKTVNGDETIEGDFTSTNSEFIYFFFTGTISVSYCFVDDIGEGEYSDTVTANVKDLIVNADNIAEGAVTTDKLAANAVTAAKISANAVTADKINSGAITADKIEAGAITAEKLAANSVTADAIQAGSVIGDKIAANTITASKLASENIDLLGTLSITGGNVKLSEEGLRLTGSDNSYTLFNSDGINYTDANGVVYAQVKKMIIGKAYDGDYIKFAAPWAKPPTVLTAPMSIQINLADYSSVDAYLICEPTEISAEGFRVNSYLKLMGGSYAVESISRTQTPTSAEVDSMTKTGYGSYTYHYKLDIYSDVLSVAIPSTAKSFETALQATIQNLATYYDDENQKYRSSYFGLDYPSANSGYSNFRSSPTITVQLYIDDEMKQETSFTIGTSTPSLSKNFTLSANFDAGATKAFIRIRVSMSINTVDHGPWSTLYDGQSYIANDIISNVIKCTLVSPYYKYEAETGKIAQGYAMFLVTDGSTNTYTIEAQES